MSKDDWYIATLAKMVIFDTSQSFQRKLHWHHFCLWTITSCTSFVVLSWFWLAPASGWCRLAEWGPVVETSSGFRVFPECVARVPVSLWGSGGWGCVRSTLRSRAQPSATVRNRLRDPRMAVPMGSSAEVVIFGGFRRVVASFRVAGVALRDIQTCSGTCRKSFCVAGTILLWRFQKMCCSFRGRRNTLDVSIVIFRGRRSTLVVSCCVFFVNRIGRAASSGDKVQIAWQAWHFLTCAENWRKPRTKHRFWGCKFSGSIRKTRRKTSILKLQSAKIGGKSRTKCSFWCARRVSSRVSGFPVASPCLWGKLQNLSFCCVANCENWRKSRTKCWIFCIHVSCLESLVFLWHRRVYGGSWKTSPIRMCPSRLSCRFAWQAWHFVTLQPVW